MVEIDTGFAALAGERRAVEEDRQKAARWLLERLRELQPDPYGDGLTVEGMQSFVEEWAKAIEQGEHAKK